eukprot:TRINITY_DN7387_c0_g1_i7.p1 TRINITY_DN7387_c0_g1~~TRINITY_DN7387_c0_g1_i7.p1  ORF type:complete len:144 (-),score=36.26 TRINITY_DN7387_c0_g1_i7:32-463(-)
MLLDVLFGTRDELTVELSLNIDRMLPIVMAVTKKKGVKKFVEKREDLKTFAKEIRHTGNLDDLYTVYAEHQEIVDDLLDESLLTVFNKYKSLVQSLHITDLAMFSTSPLAVRCDFKIDHNYHCLLYTSPSPRDGLLSRMPSSA